MTGTPAGIVNTNVWVRCPREEFVGALTHGLGLAISIAGGVYLLMSAAASGDVAYMVGCSFYALTLIAVYAASTFSHLDLPLGLHRMFRSLDQGCIYLLIVGTFTPFALTCLRSPAWLAFYGVMLFGAICGFVSKTVFAHRVERTCIVLYLALAWGEAIAFYPIQGLIPTLALYLVVAGGLCYTIGTIFLGLDIRRFHFHAIWHLLVMAGSTCHYLAILQLMDKAA